MQYTKLGNSDLQVSRIALGTWAIGGTMWGAYDEKNAVAAIESALDNGINFIDTAPVYGNGHAEELIGKIIHNKRDRIIIATKCGLDPDQDYRANLSAEFILKEIDNSLRRLQTDYVDLYQCHWPDKHCSPHETMYTLQKLQESGKIRYIGVSNFSTQETKACLKYVQLTTHQPNYSLLERSIEKELQQFCLEHKISLIPYGPLGGGVLTGKYQEWPQFDKHDARTFFYKGFQKKYWPKVNILIEKLREIATQKNCTPGNIAVSWVLSRSAVAATLVGARTPAQVQENITAAELKLSPQEILDLDNLSSQVYT